MRRNLLLAVALAVLGVVVATSAASARTDDLAGAPTSGAPVNEDSALLPACSNMRDDDSDGLVDLADPGCSGPLDDDEYNAPPPGGGGGGGGGGGTGGGGGGGGTGGGTTRVPREFFGIAHGGPQDARDYRQMHDIHIRTMRVRLSWRLTEPQKDHFRWPDRHVAVLAENGIRPMFTVFGSPGWATGNPYDGVPPLKGKAKNHWQEFLEAAVQRYGPQGSFWRDHPDVPKKAVKAWQIWNEPNLLKTFTETTGNQLRLVKHAPRAYAKLVKNSDQTITKADPHAKVILAGLTAESMFRSGDAPQSKKIASDTFLKKLLKAGNVTNHFDAVALHPYLPNLKKFKKAIRVTRKVMRKGGAGKKELWLTEMGWGSGGPSQFHLTKGKKGQAKLLKKSFKATVNNRKKWNIGRVFWFFWRDPNPSRPGSGCSFCATSGLLKFNRTRKPAYKQFKRFTEMQGKPGHHHHHAG
jgi:hypothetical protein